MAGGSASSTERWRHDLDTPRSAGTRMVHRRSTFPRSGARVRVGAFCSIATGTTFIGGGRHRLDLPTTYPLHPMLGVGDPASHPVPPRRTVVGNDVWLGLGATVLDGVPIGDGAVVAARGHA